MAWLTLLLLGVASGASPQRVVVTLAPYADLIERIGGTDVEVTTLLPPGASPHAFDPSPSQAAALARADLIVMNGGLDAWLERLVEATAPGAARFVVLGAVEESIGAAPASEEEATTGNAAGHEHDHGALNPHVWLDPRLMVVAAKALAAELSRVDPVHSEAYEERLDALVADLLELDASVAELLAPIAGAPFVPFHDAWPYFAARYGLDLVFTLEPFPGREPSPKYIAEGVAAVRRSGAKAIFAERQLDPRSAEVVAESAGVMVVTLDPLGGVPGPTRYDDLIRYNAQLILDALR